MFNRTREIPSSNLGGGMIFILENLILIFLKMKKPKWLRLANSGWILGIAILFLVLALWIASVTEGMSKTKPDEILNYDLGSLNYERLTSLSLKEYLDFYILEPSGFLGDFKDSSFFIEISEQEEIFPEEEYLDFCEGKKVEIDFNRVSYKNFEFNYGENKFDYNINLYDDLYYFSDDFKRQDCYYKDGLYERYFIEPYNSNFVKLISDDFATLKEKGFSDDEIVEIATTFVQSIPYGTDYTVINRLPYETIYEREGNCYDKSVLLGGILKNLGYEVYAFIGKSGIEYHALLGIVCPKGNTRHNGKEICYIETTNFIPIGSESDIVPDEIIKVSEGEKLYKGVLYGKEASEGYESKIEELDNINLDLDDLDYKLSILELRMCETDCLDCDGDGDDIKYCDDASKYNNLVEDYNESVE